MGWASFFSLKKENRVIYESGKKSRKFSSASAVGRQCIGSDAAGAPSRLTSFLIEEEEGLPSLGRRQRTAARLARCCVIELILFFSNHRAPPPTVKFFGSSSISSFPMKKKNFRLLLTSMIKESLLIEIDVVVGELAAAVAMTRLSSN